MPAGLERRDAGREVRFHRIGLHVGEQLGRKPGGGERSTAFAVIGILATTGSVTNSGARCLRAFRPRPVRLMRPAPKRTVVG